MPDPIQQKETFSSSRRWLNGFNAFLAVLAVFALAVMANYLAGGHFQRFQVSSNSSFRLSPQTLRILETLTNQVNITIFFDPREEEELYSLTAGLLAEYQNSNPRYITVRTLDYTRFDGEAKALLARNNLSSRKDKNFVLFECGGRSKIHYAKTLADYDMSQVLSGNGKSIRRQAFRGELLFSSAIFAVSYPRPLKTYFLSGHGEHDPESAGSEDGYSKLASILQDEISSEWARLSLQGTNDIPADCQLLIIAGPRRAQLLPTEIAKLEEYLKQGGRLLVLLNKTRLATGIEPVLSKWGVGLGETTVTERDKNFVIPPSNGTDFLTAKLRAHPMLKPLVAGELPGVRFVSPRVIYPASGATKTPDSAKVEVLAETSDVATDGERQGAFPLLISVEQGVIKGVSTPRGGTRILVAGDSHFLSDQLIDSAANHDFAGLALNWLLERPEVLFSGIGPRPIKEYKLLVSSGQMQTLQWIFLAGFPGSVLLLGGFVWLRRRS